ncbi:alpha/beta fold hydrolase [Tengunoibacter tsumagoiensis]|uniref:Hydrolase n=1 Tax=Tengunoibacter tsumagoiensis TaxID=2014871 RepID=A0A402A351_9CHLR|nr:alpha/beta hydrolase [Tengunoibacter tsumagoiensis]GCE13564.1 hydrolase [Tengunoibacter tsumagoiensis]
MIKSTTQTGFLDVQGAPFYYEVAGQGPAVLLIHAGIADHRMWDQQFATFAQQYQTIRYDLRSFGESQLPAGPFAFYEDPAALLQHLGIKKAHVIGASFGGKIALDFALTHPTMVESLLLVAPDISGYPPSDDIRRFGEEEEALLERGDKEGATELNLRMWVDGPRRTPEQIDPLVRQRVHDMQYQAFMTSVPEGAEVIALNPPAIERLEEIHAPTLVLVGDYDVPQKLVTAQELTKRINEAHSIIVPGAAHMINMELPEVFTNTALEFLHTQTEK